MPGHDLPNDGEELRRALDRVGRAFLWTFLPFLGMFVWPVLLWWLIDLSRLLAAGGRAAGRWAGVSLVLATTAFALHGVDTALAGAIGGYRGVASSIGNGFGLLAIAAYASAWAAWCVARGWHRIAGAWRQVRNLAAVPIAVLPFAPLFGRLEDGKVRVEGVAGGIAFAVVLCVGIIGLVRLGTAAESTRVALDQHVSRLDHPVG